MIGRFFSSNVMQTYTLVSVCGTKWFLGNLGYVRPHFVCMLSERLVVLCSADNLQPEARVTVGQEHFVPDDRVYEYPETKNSRVSLPVCCLNLSQTFNRCISQKVLEEGSDLVFPVLQPLQ